MNRTLRYLRRAVLLRDEAGVTDGQLLELFLARRDAEAFAALVRRHGPMVLGVCRRVLGNHHDAEDAFQATFVVLARKAASVRPRERLGPWLYGVAYRTALKMRTMARRRLARERRAAAAKVCDEAPVARPWEELVPLLDQELTRLPEKYRAPVVLCDLEGRSRREVARLLGWPEGTLSGRLARARALLAKRLARHGPAVSGGLLGALCLREASAAVPPGLLRAAVRVATSQAAYPVTVIALAEGVIKAMVIERLKVLAITWCVAGLLAAGVGAGVLRTSAAEPVQKESKKLVRPKTAAQKLEDLLPADPLPTPVVAGFDDGEVVVKFRVATYQVQRHADGTAVVTVVPVLADRRHPAEDVRAYDGKGREVDAEDLPRLLRRPVTAFAYLNGQKFDPLHLRLLKEGSLVFVLPQPAAVPPPLAPLPAIPAVPPAPGALPAGPVPPPPSIAVEPAPRVVPPPAGGVPPAQPSPDAVPPRPSTLAPRGR